MKQKVILDCDPGHDDAFAIMLALANLDVLGITTIGGNCSLENVTKNALKILEVLHKEEIGVYPGYNGPLVAPLITAPQFHGSSGLDMRNGKLLPEPKIEARKKHAADFIIDTVMKEKDVIIIATGPLTNIASAINKKPDIVKQIKEISIMGGSVTFGNWTPVSEFNIYVDPEAAYKVFNSGIHIKMSGLNLTRQCYLTQDDADLYRKIGNKAGILAAELLEYFIDSTSKSVELKGASMHDACAAAWVIDPTMIKAADMHIDVELNGTFTRGMTVCDYRHCRCSNPLIDIDRSPSMQPRGKAPNAQAGLEIDMKKFRELMLKTLRSYN